jgi:hypothetical protein
MTSKSSSRVHNKYGTKSAGFSLKSQGQPLSLSNSNTQIKHYTWSSKDIMSWFNITKKELYIFLTQTLPPVENVAVHIDGKSITVPAEVREALIAHLNGTLKFYRLNIFMKTQFISDNKDISNKIKELKNEQNSSSSSKSSG